MWLCFGYLRGVVMLWVFKGCGYVIVYLRVWLCCEYLRDVAMIWVFKGCGYVMGI
jgi:hypothetical protein